MQILGIFSFKSYSDNLFSPKYVFSIKGSSFSLPAFIFFFLGPHPGHMEVPRLGVQSELQLPAYTTATATGDPSHVCNLHHSSQQCLILNLLIEARDRTRNLMVSSWIHFCCTTKGTPIYLEYSLYDLKISIVTAAMDPLSVVCHFSNVIF